MRMTASLKLSSGSSEPNILLQLTGFLVMMWQFVREQGTHFEMRVNIVDPAFKIQYCTNSLLEQLQL